jgi:hypothetical protein
MKTIIAVLGLMLTSHAWASPEAFAYEGFSRVTEMEILTAFASKGLAMDEISPAHIQALRSLYRTKGIDFIGVVEDRDEALFTIQEEPYWSRNGYEAFIPERMNSISQLDVAPLLKVLEQKRTCLEVVKTGPESYMVNELPLGGRAGKNILICPTSS